MDVPTLLLAADFYSAHCTSGMLRHVQVHIAQRHLLPKLLAEHGLSAEQLAFPREVLEAVASGWTREAGVRRLSQARTWVALSTMFAETYKIWER